MSTKSKFLYLQQHMIKRILSGLALTSCLYLAADASLQYPKTANATTSGKSAIAQSPANDQLFYTYFGKRIPLNLRQDTFVVQSKTEQTTRGGTRGGTDDEEESSTSEQPFFQQLQQYLQPTSRGEGNDLAKLAKIQPLGENYAVVSLPDANLTIKAQLQDEIAKLPNVAATLPVLSRQGRQEIIALPNEIIVSFQRNLSENQRQDILKQQNLEIIRKIPFTRDRYVVRTLSASGTAVLNAANQLIQVTGVKSATPNFIQSIPERVTPAGKMDLNSSQNLNAVNQIVNDLAKLPSQQSSTFNTALLPLQWQLDSSSLSGYLDKNARKKAARTDIRAVEAWQQSQGGRGVVVAVIDTTIQWNHPDLKNNLYTAANLTDQCPGEVHGWDFASMSTVTSNDETSCPGDPNTRLNSREIGVLAPIFQDTFKLSDQELIQKYDNEVLTAKYFMCGASCSNKQIANSVRDLVRNRISGKFHGTWVSGVIAARSPNGKGLMGVAPNAKILPVRTAGIGGEFSPESIMASINYAVARGADVINMSFGGSTPIQDVADTISEVLANNPKLVIVASAGNSGDTQNWDVNFPANMPGVVAVGATNLAGRRTGYSSFGETLGVVAPGGDLYSPSKIGGILTTGGTWLDKFWQDPPKSAWGDALDKKGGYMWVQGTSFSAPVVAGVFALMKGEIQSVV